MNSLNLVIVSSLWGPPEIMSSLFELTVLKSPTTNKWKLLFSKYGVTYLFTFSLMESKNLTLLSSYVF